jgi:hypothetical protein
VQCPRKKDGLEVHSVGGKFVIYETEKDAVHYLNPTAVLVLECCDGTSSAGQIAEAVRELYALPAPPLHCTVFVDNAGKRQQTGWNVHP